MEYNSKCDTIHYPKEVFSRQLWAVFNEKSLLRCIVSQKTAHNCLRNKNGKEQSKV